MQCVGGMIVVNTVKGKMLIRAVELINSLCVTLIFSASWFLYYVNDLSEPFYRIGNYFIIILFFLLYFCYARIYDGFGLPLNRITEMFGSQALALFFSDGIMYIVIILLTRKIANVIPMILSIFIQLIFCGVWCVLAHKLYFMVFPPTKTAVIYDMRDDVDELLSSHGLKKRFNIISSVRIEDVLKNDLNVLNNVENVFLAGVHSHDRNILLKKCVENNITVYVIPRIGDVIMSGATRMHMMHLPMLRVGRYNPSPEYLFVKRFMDIVFSLLGIIILSPIFIIVSIAIKASDGGPVFYKQCRLTKDGKKFNVLKFRSMRVDAEKDGVARLSTGDNDDRVTPVGKIIRKFRLDELPQLINILAGDMSLVGPRPERPEIAKEYEKDLPEFALRLQVKAGLTGYAQVYGKYNTMPYDKLIMDLMYISAPSIIEDLKIIFATVKILFVPDSTEGVDVGKSTAEK